MIGVLLVCHSHSTPFLLQLDSRSDSEMVNVSKNIARRSRANHQLCRASITTFRVKSLPLEQANRNGSLVLMYVSSSPQSTKLLYFVFLFVPKSVLIFFMPFVTNRTSPVTINISWLPKNCCNSNKMKEQ